MPRPIPTAWSEPFWEGLRRGEFLLQRCTECGRFAGYPKVFCPHCYADGLEWVPASGRGSVYTFTTVTANPPSTFLGELPYTIAIVTLEEGPRFLSRLVDVPPQDVQCGMSVQLVLRENGDGDPMPFFAPAAAP
jgi:uncharacterized OB-fold protein